MNMKMFLPILSIGLILSSCGDEPAPEPSIPTLESISLSGSYKTEFKVNESFSYSGLVVSANYSDSSSKTVTEYTVSNPDMSVLGKQEVTVTYMQKEASYEIRISDEVTSFPLEEVISFLSSRGVASPSNYIINSISSITKIVSFGSVEDDDSPFYEVVTSISTSECNNIIDQLTSSSWTYEFENVLVDSTKNIGIKIVNESDVVTFTFYAYEDLVVIPPEEDDKSISKTDDFVLYEIIGNEKSNLENLNPISPEGHTDFVFNFYANGESNKPISNKDKGYKCIAVYTNNSFTVETASSTYLMQKIEFTIAGKDGQLTVDVGQINQTSEKTIWTGESNKVTFTASAQYRFDNVHIEYTVPKIDPIPEGVKTISEVYAVADSLVFKGSDGYLVNNDVTIEVCLKAIDAIDSVTTTGGLSPQARGKVICVDDTGYIVCSSGVSKNNPIDFYQRVKDYIKAGTTTYYVKGHLAKLNGVLEINVEEYKYRSELTFDYDLNDFVTSGVSDSSSLMSHCQSIVTNKNGYGLGKIVRLNALTYFEKYNDAGSYYFLDQDGQLVPIYSLLDKDRSNMQLGKVYDIIGIESIYQGRPSLRILEVTPNLEVDPASFDFTSAIERENTKYFYNVNSTSISYQDEFYNSVTTVYKMDVYVSSYAYDKYTFSDTYYKYNKTFTTGSSQVAASQHYSLGVFNSDLDRKQIFTDLDLANADSEEDCESLKFTIYFTLCYLDTVDGKEMWRVNVFEDLVFGIDYYNSSTFSIDFTSMVPTHDSSKQVYTSQDLVVTNASTSINPYSYSVDYLKVVDGTSLNIKFNHNIIAFSINNRTYSYISGIEGVDIKAYRQFNDYTVFLLDEPTNEILITDFGVGGNRNNAYLAITSLTVHY